MERDRWIEREVDGESDGGRSMETSMERADGESLMERDRWRERMERDQWREGGWEVDVEVDEAISMERGGWRGSGWREWMK
jgi:hypothetical protein